MSTVEKTMEKVTKFFSTTKKGELHELKEMLLSNKEEKRVEAVKQVIAEMTEGKDVSVLFTDVINCMQTDNLELKKLVYLYVMNYAKSNPDRAILAINTFHKDASNINPLIRALAIRTMSCIRVDQIAEYLVQPLQMCLKHEDPYVRKTAAVAVAKLYDLNPEIVENYNFLKDLNNFLADSNPMVVANAVAVLSEIAETSNKEVFKINSAVLPKLLSALNECTEWGQVFILDSLARYEPANSKEAESICERVAIRFNHSNSAVIMSAVKVVLLCLPYITEKKELRESYNRKLSPPLVTLLSSGKEPEIQYVALRNINIIVQKYPHILQNEVKIFFCKYNDPIYVKLEKLELMIMLANEKNIDMVLSEFKEYATMVDVEFVRKSVRAIGRCAVKLPGAADRCVQVLLDLIQTKVNYVVQEAVVVIKDIFRKYPNKYESIIATLCENLETLDEPEAKASMIWIIGEYADRIDNADELLDRFLEGFGDESAQVQLALLTAVVKLFLRKPDNQGMVQAVLDKTTKECDNPDLRDRGFMYWRLLSADPEAAKEVVLAERPLIKDTSSALEPELLDLLMENLGTLASVFHKPPSSFVSKIRTDRRHTRVSLEEDEDEDADEAISSDAAPAPAAPAASSNNILDLLGDSVPAAAPAPAAAGGAAAAPAPSHSIMDDLLGISVPSATAAAAPAPAAGGFDMFGAAAAPAAGPTSDKPLLLDSGKGNGMEVHGLFARRDKQVFFDLTLINRGAAPLSQFAIQFNKNNFGITAPQQIPIASLAQGQSADASLPISMQGVTTPGPLNPTIQIAIRNSTGQIYIFTAQLPTDCYFAQGAQIDQQAFLAAWGGLPEATQAAGNVPLAKVTNISALNAALASVGISTIGIAGQTVLTFMKLANGTNCLCEIAVNGATRSCQVVCRSADNTLASSVLQLISSLL